MKHLILTCLLALAAPVTHAQIRLPKDYRCIYGNTVYSNDRLTVAYSDGSDAPDNAAALMKQMTAANKLPFKKMPDGLYRASGKVRDHFSCIVLVPETRMLITVSSKKSDAEFTEQCAWMLEQIRAQRQKSAPDYSLVNSDGKVCN